MATPHAVVPDALPAPATEPLHTNPRILLVDDSPAIHVDFAKILCPPAGEEALDDAEAVLFGIVPRAAARFELDSAYQGAEAVERVRSALAQERPYAVAFVDMRMPPGLDGAQTAEALWQIDPRLLVVICTAYSDLPWEQLLQRLGGGDRLLILRKPFDVFEVVQLARTLTAKWSLAREAERHARATEETLRELRASQAELSSAAEALGGFAHAVSHDLQSPLARIESYGALLAEELEGRGSEKALHYLERMRANAKTGQDLVKGLLMLTDIARSRFQPECLDIGAIACELLAELRESSPDRKVAATVAPGLAVWGDPVLLRIALANLLGNAWKFSSRVEHARIEVGQAERAAHRSVFYVRDNGCGFDMSFADRLFRNFQRLHDADEYPGTGVGLATVTRIIARHGGELRVESAPGAGCTIYFSLPHGPVPADHPAVPSC